MVEYSKLNVKLSDTQIKNYQSTAAKNKTGATLRIRLKCLMEMIYHMNYY